MVKGKECIAIFSSDEKSAMVYTHIHRDYWESIGSYNVIDDKLVDKNDDTKIIGKILTKEVNWDRI
jgi:hypothetical protein